MKRTIKKTIKYILVTAAFIAVAYFFPIPLLILILCGVYDVSRNRGLDAINGVFYKNWKLVNN